MQVPEDFAVFVVSQKLYSLLMKSFLLKILRLLTHHAMSRDRAFGIRPYMQLAKDTKA
jgi:hypothetical protein